MQIRRLKIYVIFIFLLWTMVYGQWTTSAGVPRLINYQARLTDKDGKALEGRRDITFGIYDVESGGAALWEEEWDDLDISKGIVSVELGDKTALDLLFDKDYYLQIKVGDEVMLPRQRITSVGYAIKADVAETANLVKNTDTVDGYDTSTVATKGKIPVMGDNGYLPDNSVDITALKTATGEVSIRSILVRIQYGSYKLEGSDLILPGGEYGFYPQLKQDSDDGEILGPVRIYGHGGGDGISATKTYKTLINLEFTSSGIGYVKQRYITASGIDYWVFILTDKTTKEIISVWASPDHPAYGNGGDFEKLAHPFSDFNTAAQEISLVCNDSVKELKSKSTKEKGIVELVNEDYKVDFSQTLKYAALHSGKYIDDNGKQIKHLVESIPAYIEVRKLVKLTSAEKRAREARAKQAGREYEVRKQRQGQKRKAAVAKLGALGLSEEDIRVVMERE